MNLVHPQRVGQASHNGQGRGCYNGVRQAGLTLPPGAIFKAMLPDLQDSIGESSITFASGSAADLMQAKFSFASGAVTLQLDTLEGGDMFFDSADSMTPIVRYGYEWYALLNTSFVWIGPNGIIGYATTQAAKAAKIQNYLSTADKYANFIESKFTPIGGKVAATYVSPGGVSSNIYTLRQNLGNSRCLAACFYGEDNPTVGATAYKMQKVYVQKIMAGSNESTTPPITRSGFFGNASGVAYYGGKIRWSGTAGEYLAATFANCTSLGVIITTGSTNTGLFKVSVDGNSTLANLLPSAQDVVDSGAFANTILIANGGSLNPTDRVLDTYNKPANLSQQGKPETITFAYVECASGLTSGDHTVRLTVTGYKNTASSGVTVYVNCLVGGGGDYQISSNLINVYLNDVSIATTARPVWDLSYSTIPSGAVNAEWMGHDGSEKIAVLPKLLMDGVEISPAAGAEYTGNLSAVLEMSNNLRHTETGSTNIGVITYTYKFEPILGLTVSHSLTWAVNGAASGYPGMLSVDAASFDRYNTPGNADIALPGNTGQNYINSAGELGWAWKSDGNVAAMMRVPTLAAVDNWQYAGAAKKLFWYDYIGSFRKLYAMKYSDIPPIHAFTPGDTITSEINYRLGYYPDGANADFAGSVL